MKPTTKARFDKEGYQKGEPHLHGEKINFEAIARAKPLSRVDEMALGLPNPEELAGKTPSTKINLAIDDDALEYFKGEAKRLGTSYQRMIRNLIAAYARQRRHHA